MKKLFRTTLGPLFLIVCCSPFVMLMWYTNTVLEGSFAALGQMMFDQGFFSTLYTIWQPVFWGSSTAWGMIAIFILFEFVLIKLLPGNVFHGPMTPKGNVPVYKANGILAFIVSIATFCVASFGFDWFSATIIYDHLGELLSALNLFSLFFCAFLYLKGRYLPSSSDSGITGNLIFDYYWGTELYPIIGGVNLKMLINCRIGMMSWGIILISFAAKQAQLYGLSNSMLISVMLQLVYITKFFIWETGYLASLDVMHDRSGFYICWGLLVWVPGIYTSPTMYLVNHPNQLSYSLACFFAIGGLFSIYLNYWADRQRQIVRVTQGECKIWGKKPTVSVANYVTEAGETKQSLLLSSGWWGVARHFHYLPEITAAFFWSAPALFIHWSPYFYVVYLTILLVDRSYRDDLRCAQKYGPSWQNYCREVPYKIIPFVF